MKNTNFRLDPNVATLKKEKKINKLFMATFINVAFLVICQLVFKLNFEILDELVYSELIADGQTFNNFSNSILLVIIGALQKLIYPINAYVVFALALSLACLISICYIFFDKFEFKTAVILSILLNGFTATSYYTLVSFTRIPSLLCTASLLCILHYANKKKWLFGMLWGFVLVVIASFYRIRVFETVALVFVVYLLSVSIVKYIGEKNKKEALKAFLKDLFEPKRLICGVLLAATCLSLSHVNANIVKNSPELSYYRSYTRARSQIYDYDTPSYESCKEQYDAIGVDAEDLYFLDVVRYCDDKAYPLETLQKIGEVRNSVNAKHSVLQVIQNTITEEFTDAYSKTDKTVLDLAIIGAFVAFFIVFKRKYLIVEISLLLVAAGLYFYLHNAGRVLCRHVYIFWLPIIVFLLYTLDSSAINEKLTQKIKGKFNKNNSKRITALILAFSIMLSAAFSFAFWYKGKYQENNRFDRIQAFRAPINEYVKAHPDDRFELCKDANLYEGNIDNKSLYYINNQGRYGNSHIFQAIYYRLPYFNEFDKQIFGTDDLYENLFHEHVYYVDWNNHTAEHMRIHLQRYYTEQGETVTFEKVDEVDNFQIIRFTKQ